jgi:uncharacterized protein with FMN-binding domain
MSNHLLYIVIAVAVGVGIVATVMNHQTPQTENESVVCTMDAKQCPDGSYVGRTGQNCEFVCP